MKNINTATTAPWDRPSWTDGNIALHEQFGLTAYEARIGRWCFDGDGGDDDGSDADADDMDSPGGMGAEAAAEAAAASDMDADSLSTDAPGLTADQAADWSDAVGDLSGYSSTDAAQAASDLAAASIGGYSADMSGYTTDQIDEAVNSLNDRGVATVGYNDLVDFGYFDKKEEEIAEANRQEADRLTSAYADRGYNVTVGVDPVTGTFSYEGPDAGLVGLNEMSKGAADLASTIGMASSLSPGGLLSGALGGFGVGGQLMDSLGYASPFDSNTPSRVENASRGGFLGVDSNVDLDLETPDPVDFGLTQADLNEAGQLAAQQGLVDEMQAEMNQMPTEAEMMADFQLGLDQRMNEVPSMAEASLPNDLVDDDYITDVETQDYNFDDEDYDTGDSEFSPPAPPAAPPPKLVLPSVLSSYNPPPWSPPQFSRLGLLAPRQVYGPPARQALVQQYMNAYPSLDEAFSRQMYG